MPGKIVIKGARQHNLKNIDLEIPRDRLVVITGVSGSGKSSLAFDTLYAEGQRRYVESLSADARQFLRQMERPDVDSIDGLSPAVAIEQRGAIQNPRSTVGTITEIYDYLRLLFARVGKPHCWQCGNEISAQTIQQIVDRLRAFPPQTQLHILAPIGVADRKPYQRELDALARAGFARVQVDGKLYELAEASALKRPAARRVDLVVDRLAMRGGIEKRLADSLEVASRYGKEVIKVDVLPGGGSGQTEELIFTQKAVCARCGISYPEIAPSFFSFNSPQGACPACGGLGRRAVSSGKSDAPEISSDGPPCRECEGARLRKESLHVKVGGKNIADVAKAPIDEAREFLLGLKFPESDRAVAGTILRDMARRLGCLSEIGLSYLTLDRPAATLSGGETHRVHLATQIGAGLVGVLYILDEPSVGLHQRDNGRLLALLRRLQELGNTVLVLEHDRETILAADYVVDLGPGAGVNGGEVIACGTPDEIMANENSQTGGYLSGRLRIPVPAHRRRGSGEALTLKGARQHNLKNITVSFPVGAMSCVTGVSGSGKSTLVVDTLYWAMAQRLLGSKANPGLFDELAGWDFFDNVISVDQSPIGRTPRSNPATYTGLFDPIRDLFAQLPEARVRGFKAGRFSFNARGGRCEACAGDGITRIEMHFLPDVFVTCEVCHGRRYNRETLEVMYKGRSIADVLDLTVNEALEFLANFPAARRKLETLRDVGMGYVRLGQPATTLSGGEAQRIKLAEELSKRSTGRTLYILDEPTTGLHFDDVRKLLEVLDRLTEAGNTLIVIEHNQEVIKSADYVLDLGPDGGINGGEVVACGTPEDIAGVDRSLTGLYLKEILVNRKT